MEQQQIAFSDADPGYEVDFETSRDSTFNHGGLSGLQLGDFLSRPVLVDDTTWTEGTQLASTIDPWTGFLTNAAIKNKLEHYSLLRMNLRVKFIISASPFYYGCIMITYNPLPATHNGPLIIVAGDEQLVTYSQRPRLLLNTTTSQGGEMELPFFYNKNWLKNKAADIATMGQLRLDSFGDLQNANSVAGATVNIRTYVWAVRPELSGPTIQAQAKKRVKMKSVKDKITAFGTQQDEYGTGPISGVASAIATAGGALQNVPIIGPYARATQIGAGALSRVAAWFGFTNVPVISNNSPVKDTPFRGFASTDIGDTTEKLTYDPKNELTLDSRTVGLDGTDELSMVSYVGRESYITYFDWAQTDASNDLLWASWVTPSLYRNHAAPTATWMTPMCHLGCSFMNWTGDIIFRFVVVSTQYHRGRLKISWDPYGDIVGSSDNETANITKIIDISECNDIELRIPYMNAMPWLKTYRPTDFVSEGEMFGATGGTPTYDDTYFNGRLTIRVSNELTSPVAGATVRIVCFVRGADNLRFNNPVQIEEGIAWYSQSEVSVTSKDFKPKGDSDMPANDADDEEDCLTLVTFGEQMGSIRALMHRMNISFATVADFGTSNQTYAYMNNLINMFPPPPGEQSYSNAIHTSSTAVAVNFSTMTPLNWFTPCFAGRRGSINWSVNYHSVDQGNQVCIFRTPMTVADSTTYKAAGYVTAANNQNQFAFYSTQLKTNSGGFLGHTRTQQGVTVQVPFMSPYRFHDTKPSTVIAGVGNLTPYQEYDSFAIWSWFCPYALVNSASGAQIPRANTMTYSCGAGPDFNLFFFTGVPTIQYVYYSAATS